MPLVVEKLNHIYMKGGPYETQALSDISFTIQDGEFVGLIGHTGSGKSTLVQHLNGLLQPTSGRVLVDGTDLADKTAENQLFEETVAKDIAFGPKNLGLDAGEVDRRVREAMRQVSLDYDRISGKSVFDLSGGQMRRVAIAGVLAMKPSVLVLDEPCAGLDPHGREEILGLIRRLHRESGVTIVMVSHSMDDVAQLAERVMVMHRGHLVMDGRPEEIFSRGEELRKMGLDVPQVVQLGEQLRARGYEIPEQIYRMEDMQELLIRLLKKGEYHAQ